MSKTWLITGTSRGIGKAIAEAALQNGDQVIATARNLADLAALAAEWPETCRTLVLDMTKPEEIKNVAETAPGLFNGLDILVNNAGYGVQGMIEEVALDQVRHQMEVNFFGLVDLTQRLIPHFRSQGSGYIVNVSSVAGLTASAGLGIYHASKFAVNGFTESLSKEMAEFGVKVSCVEPGPYRTDWAGDSLIQSDALKNEEKESPYASANKTLKDFYAKRDRNQPGDPRQIASVLVDAAYAEEVPLHMLFGDVAIEIWGRKKAALDDPKHFSVFPHDQFTLSR